MVLLLAHWYVVVGIAASFSNCHIWSSAVDFLLHLSLFLFYLLDLLSPIFSCADAFPHTLW